MPDGSLAPRQHPGLRIGTFKPVKKGALRGFVTVHWNAAGLVFSNVGIFVSREGKPYAALPAAPVIDSTGRHHRVNGKKQFHAVCNWKSRERADAFSAKIVDLICRKYPDALDPPGDPA